MKADRFREDLYYRLNVVPINVPPLRERLEDIELFVQAFSKEFTLRSALKPKIFAPAAIERLDAHPWPGNVRELKNIVERLLIMTRSDKIGEDDVANALSGVDDMDDFDAMEAGTLREARARFEREYLSRKLAENKWNVTRTAEAIGVERTHLHRKMKSYGIETGSGRSADGEADVQ